MPSTTIGGSADKEDVNNEDTVNMIPANSFCSTGEMVRTLRIFSGESLEDLARDVDVALPVMGFLENDKFTPQLDLIERIARHYNVTPELVSIDAIEKPGFRKITKEYRIREAFANALKAKIILARIPKDPTTPESLS